MKEIIRNIIKDYKDERFDKFEECLSFDKEKEIQDLYLKILNRLSSNVKMDFRKLIYLIQENEKRKLELGREDLLCLGIKIGIQIKDCMPKS